MEQQGFSLKTQATVVTPSKSSIHLERTQNGINKKQMQIMAEICQNRPAGRNRFFGGGQKSVSGQQLPKSYFPLIRGHSWHKKQTKRIMRGHY